MPRGARVGVPGEALHVFERDALRQQVRDRGDSEGMRGLEQGEADILEPALHHAADIIDVNRLAGKLPLLL